eukprot:TRINITY_DN11057_c0_g2_i1.p1 TRINITY_DN11057_c0_g2~~TRINITY_DN11057_c0_g2_i1.p1  ORF type:complete len:111 (+),score=14.66 TRINITY_DN11057_c0_g2_i1:127-459(+)
MSSLPTLFTQMKELRSSSKDGQRGGSDNLPRKANDSQDGTLLTGSPLHRNPRNFQTSQMACSEGPSGHRRRAESERQFSSEPPNPALSALQFFRAREERCMARKNAPFQV